MKSKVKILIENILKESAEDKQDKPKIKLVPLWQDREQTRLKQYEKILSQETINGDLDLGGSLIENLGNVRHVKGFLNLNGCKNLKELPEGLIVDGWIDLTNCRSLESLPSNLQFDRHLWLIWCQQQVIKQAIEMFDRRKVTY